MNFKEKTVKESYIYNGKILNLRKDDIVLPDGNSAIREVVEHSGGCSVLCEKDGKILFVRQFRYPYKEEILELPAGKLNPGEEPEQTAIRELEEEGGIKAGRVEKMFEVYPSPGYTNEIIRIYRALDIQETNVHLDEDEFLESVWLDKNQIKEMLKKGEFKDAKTLIALLAVL